MKWFEGSIVDAVAASQATKCLFCAVILGDGEDSQALENSLESEEIQTINRNEKVICIRLTAGSEEFQHFLRIFTNAKCPSIFCITKDAPPEILPATLDSASLKERFESAVKRHKELIVAAAVADAAILAQLARAPAGPSQGTGTGIGGGSTSSAPSSSSSSAPSNGDGQVPLESRIERAKVIAAAKQQKKAEEEAEEEKRREIERRQVGQKVAELKRWQEEQEIKKLAEERRKDKEQEAQLRQRLRDQIAQDRIDRQARVNMTSGVAPTTATDGPTSSNSAPSSSSNVNPTNFSGQARLQFRLPEGTTKTHSFDPDSTLGHVRQYVIDHVVPYRDFSIWVAFPRREFTSSDYGTTLRDLGLLPSTALLIIPVTGKSIMQNAGNAGHGVINFLTTFFGYVIFPVTFILTLLQRALPAPAPQNNSSPETASNVNTRNPRNIGKSSPGTSSTSTKKAEAGPSTSNNERSTKPAGSQGKKGTEKGTTEGNVHRLRTFESDSDDEQATWNGNSTQQM